MTGTVKPKTTVKLRAKAHSPSHSLSQISIRDLTFAIDEPVERGGSNLGPTPTDAAIAALVGCTNVIGHKCAAELGVDIGHLTISADCEFDRRGVTLSQEIDTPFERIVLKIECDGGATHEQLQAVATAVSRFCPLSKLFRNSGTVIEEIWTVKKA